MTKYSRIKLALVNLLYKIKFNRGNHIEEIYIFISSKCLLKTVVIYHEAVSKLVFVKISFSIKIIVNRQTFHYLLIFWSYCLSSKLSSSSKYYRVSWNSLFIMETVVTSRSTWIVKTIPRVWEAMKIKVKTVVNSLNWSVSATMTECLLIWPLNYIRSINFFLFSFLKCCDFMFFAISIFVVVKEHVNGKCIFMLFLVFVVF